MLPIIGGLLGGAAGGGGLLGGLLGGLMKGGLGNLLGSIVPKLLGGEGNPFAELFKALTPNKETLDGAVGNILNMLNGGGK
jgi:hypothetical protein